ncbi:ribonuclease III [Bartonella doshiae]|uniref:Ribonuclease 3 n=2 Tax=Bartonella doshiae TaxID=33044 RepID=A0A380ZE95_BARDO|nr:ribonuclease III [Bartonella doshiae]EJF81931.1 ribonuclease 3 [Bartonella doshiae NCTC 12862 = ATCC 700133]MBB6159357.1 ribonuclease-3 [Bartonella doshiae]SUV44642.1 Ribonuclease 3 [Bartonella doshiae]
MKRSMVDHLEKLTGHRFKDEEKLKRALTHSSVQDSEWGNYERLEFLGDRVLGLLIAEMLYQFFPQASEGELSVRLNGLVNAQTCADIALELGLSDMIHVGFEMRSLKGRRLTNMYADVIEALIAVMYLDGGLQSVRPFIQRYWQSRAQQMDAGRRDAKTELQEWAHIQGGLQPDYRVVKRSGPDHDPIFIVEVSVSGFAPEIGQGSSKRCAERMAAEKILRREGIWKTMEKNDHG